MNVIVKKKYSLRNRPFYKLYGTSVAFVEPDPESRALYSNSLLRVNIDLEQFETIAQLMEALTQKNFQVIIVSPATHELPQLAQLKSFAPDTPLVTVSRMMPERQLDGIMKLGVTLHINRDLSRPRDLLVALEQILLN